ncbi:hypothetical protein [uncultured Brevundimonas sp.]|uniref:hypothetical protein n=1 Tax=uncultured Brevundimonas sp. TaxID=213418 RepID=UPI0030EBF9CD|tara:strand:- start:4033 stop:4317 length:285 start_codon:yes stop_codon:yes gene_type:complete
MNNYAKIGAVPPIVVATSGSTANGDFHQSKAQQDAERASRYRLVIEEGSREGSFIYKTLDRLTGEVIRQLPREQIVELKGEDDYAAGAVIDTSA